QRPAFPEKDRNQLIKQVTAGPPPSPRKLNSSIPRDLETIILKAIDREPASRYQSARALADDLRRFIDDKPILARQASLSERFWRGSRRNPAIAGLSAAIVILLVALALGSTIVAVRFEGMARSENQLRVIADGRREQIAALHEEALANLKESQKQK